MHALVRTNAKGQPFVGKCSKCGVEGLTLKQMDSPCVNPAGLTVGEALELMLRILDSKNTSDAEGGE